MTERSSRGGERRTPAAQENLAAKKERHGKSDAIGGLIFSLIGLPLCVVFVFSFIGLAVSKRALSRLERHGPWRVLATVGLLLGLAGPPVGLAMWYSGLDGCGSRERARRRSCLNNLKQITTGILTYTTDYGGSYPAHTAPGREGTTSFRDLGILHPMYVTSLDVFVSPSSGDRVPKRTTTAYDNKPFPAEEARHVSYAYGLNKNAKNKAWTQSAPRTTRVLADRPAARPLTKRSNHKTDGRNVAFADGHVKWVSGGAPLDSDPENPDSTAHGTGNDWWSER